MLLIDDYYRMTWVVFLKEKYEAFENLLIGSEAFLTGEALDWFIGLRD
jgi:hypothetical protein